MERWWDLLTNGARPQICGNHFPTNPQPSTAPAGAQRPDTGPSSQAKTASIRVAGAGAVHGARWRWENKVKGRGSGDCLEIFSIMMGRKGENFMEFFISRGQMYV